MGQSGAGGSSAGGSWVAVGGWWGRAYNGRRFVGWLSDPPLGFTVLMGMAVWCSWLALMAAAQAGSGAQGPVPLGPAYVDAQAGFSVRPPVGAAVIRHAPDEPGQRPDLFQVVSFVLQEPRWNLAVQMMIVPPEQSLADSAGRILGNAEQRLGLKRQEQRTGQVGRRDAVIFSARGLLSQVEVRCFCAVVQVSRSRRFVLELTGPAEQGPALEASFDAVLSSFEVLIDPNQEAVLQRASQAGERLLREVAASGLVEQLAGQRYYRFVKDGKDVGYVAITEEPYAFRYSPGVHVVEQGWLFDDPPGGIRKFQADLFVANDLRKERWTSRAQQILPVEQGQPRRYLASSEQGLGQQDKLVVSFAADTAGQQPANRVFELPSDYLPQVLTRILPRFLPLDSRGIYVFTCYDSQGHCLATRRYDLVGQDSIDVAGSTVAGYRIEDRQGAAAEPAVLWVDAAGRLLKARTGQLEMILAEKQQVDLLYGSRCTGAEAELRAVAGGAGAR
jgi:hypothetical protein